LTENFPFLKTSSIQLRTSETCRSNDSVQQQKLAAEQLAFVCLGLALGGMPDYEV
jgi:hypothetical protein